MQRAVVGDVLDDLFEIYKLIKQIPMYELMFFIPNTIQTFNKDLGILKYKTTCESLLDFINKGNLVIKERELFFYKKHLSMCLEELHKHNIFYYFHIDNLYIHDESKMPLMHHFDKSCIIVFDNEERKRHILEKFSKPIKNKYIPFSLFFFHFIAFSLTKADGAAPKEVSIYELYDNNVGIFYGWSQDELKEVESIVREGKNYQGIFEYYLNNSALWFHWDYVLLERCFMKIM